MKTLIKFAEENDLIIRIITYNFNGIRIKRKGFDLEKNGKTVLKLEPKNYVESSMFYKDKWMASKEGEVTYLKRLTLKQLRSL
tara:strand:+ start:1538 stop:1786 length:249 start_codon:yes stop_codon:yes gene_type:complete